MTRWLALVTLVLAGTASACGSRGPSVDGGMDASIVDGPLEDARSESSVNTDESTVRPSTFIQAELTYVGPGANGVAAGNYENNFEVWTVSRDGGNNTQITGDGKEKFAPKFSPGGTKLLYTAYTTGWSHVTPNSSDVYVWDLTTGTQTQLTDDGISGYAMWSPDGTKIAYMSGVVLSSASPRVSAPSDGGPFPFVFTGTGLWLMNADGTGKTKIASPSGTPDDLFWPGDSYWSQTTNRIVIAVITNVSGCWNAHLDSLWPDGSHRTTMDLGSTSCFTPPLNDIPGDADPGWGAGGDTLLTSRGYEVQATNSPVINGAEINLRRIYSMTTDGSDVETDLSVPSGQTSCSEGLPRGSPDGQMFAWQSTCFADGGGVVLPTGSFWSPVASGSLNRNFIAQGGDPDWNPAFGPASQGCLTPDSGTYYIPAISVLANQNPALGVTNEVCCTDELINHMYCASFTSYPFALAQDETTKAYIAPGHPFSCNVTVDYDDGGVARTSFALRSPGCTYTN